MQISTRPVLAALLLLPLVACDTKFDTEDKSTSSVATDNQNYAAQLSRAQRYVYVTRGSGSLTTSDQAGLANFIAEQAAGRSSAVHVALTGPVGPLELRQVTQTLVAAGVDPDKIEYNANQPVDGSAPKPRAGMAVVAVETERWKPVLPNCPDHSALSILDSSNPNSTNFGCATATNLSLMVSDPRDLIAGETGGHTDAALTTAAIERLEQDKVKALKGGSTSSVAGGS